MNFEEYIQNEQARDSIRRMLEADSPLMVLHAMSEERVTQTMSRSTEGVWQRIRVASYHAYYRPDRDRFIVSDLGDGVKAYRMRTGRELLRLGDVSVDAELDVSFADHILTAFDPRNGWRNVDKDLVPDAICRVLLASYRVANL